MKKLICIFSLLILFTASLHAQEWNTLLAQLRRMEIQILRVHALADRYQNQQAQQLISKARNAFITAKDLASNRRFVEARAKFLEARELLEQSTRILLYKPAISLKLDLDRLIHDAEQASFDNPSVEGQYLLNRAKSFQSKALDAFNSSDYLEGERYFRIARFYARKSLQISGGSSNTKDWTTEFMDQYNAQQNLYQELENSGIQNSDADEVLKKTKIYLQQAKDNFDKKNRREAFANLQIAERFLLRTIDLNRVDEVSEENLKNESLISLRQFLDGIEMDVEQNENREARNLLQKANHFYNGAERDIENGQFKAARNKLHLAQRMGARALQLSDERASLNEDQIPDRISELRRIIELQWPKIEESENTSLSDLYQEAKTLLDRAQSEYENGNANQAYALAGLVLRITNRIEYLIKFNTSTESQTRDFESNYQKIENNLSLIEKSQRLNDFDKTRAKALRGLLTNAGKYYENGDDETALELLNIIQTQLSEIIKNARN
jgi:hypothetical protein